MLALGERPLHLAADEEYICNRAKKTKSHFIVNHVSDERPANAVASLRCKFVTMMPIPEWALVLYVGEEMVPVEFVDARDPLRANRQKREDAKRCNDH